MDESEFIGRLKNKQAAFAREALEKPHHGGSSFGYGYAAGIHRGLQEAINDLLSKIKEDEKDGEDL